METTAEKKNQKTKKHTQEKPEHRCSSLKAVGILERVISFSAFPELLKSTEGSFNHNSPLSQAWRLAGKPESWEWPWLPSQPGLHSEFQAIYKVKPYLKNQEERQEELRRCEVVPFFSLLPDPQSPWQQGGQMTVTSEASPSGGMCVCSRLNLATRALLSFDFNDSSLEVAIHRTHLYLTRLSLQQTASFLVYSKNNFKTLKRKPGKSKDKASWELSTWGSVQIRLK